MFRRFVLPIVGILIAMAPLNTVEAGHTPYPIIFVHGLVGSDETFRGTMEHLRDEYNLNSIHVFDVLLNADNNNSTAILGDDVRWTDFVYDGNTIQVGRRDFVDSYGDFAEAPSDYVEGVSCQSNS